MGKLIFLAKNNNKNVREIGEFLLQRKDKGLTSVEIYLLMLLVSNLDIEQIQMKAYNDGYMEGKEEGEEIGYQLCLNDLQEGLISVSTD